MTDNAPQTLWVVVDKDGRFKARIEEHMAAAVDEWDECHPKFAPHRVVAYSPAVAQGADDGANQQLQRIAKLIGYEYAWPSPSAPDQWFVERQSPDDRKGYTQAAHIEAAIKSFAPAVPQGASVPRADIRKLAFALQSAAYRHGQIDAEDRWSNKKYRDVADAADAAREKLLDTILDTIDAAPREPVKAAIKAEPVALKLFTTTVLGIGPYCIEFPDGEIIHTRSAQRQADIAALYAAQEDKP